jgi:hypothetical protein
MPASECTHYPPAREAHHRVNHTRCHESKKARDGMLTAKCEHVEMAVYVGSLPTHLRRNELHRGCACKSLPRRESSYGSGWNQHFRHAETQGRNHRSNHAYRRCSAVGDASRLDEMGYVLADQRLGFVGVRLGSETYRSRRRVSVACLVWW